MLDLPDGFLDELLAFCAKFPSNVKDYEALDNTNLAFKNRKCWTCYQRAGNELGLFWRNASWNGGAMIFAKKSLLAL